MNKDVRQLATWVKTNWPGRAIPDSLHEVACRLLGDEKASRARKRVKAAPRGKAKAETREARNARMAEIRRQVFATADGLCELCWSPATEAHHLISGPLRRAQESVATMLAVCTPHHLALHRGDLDSLEGAYNFCLGSGMKEAATALRKRIDKILEARSQHPERKP